MGAVKNHLYEVLENLRAGDYATALELLEVWGEDAPLYLWGCIEDLIDEKAQDAEAHNV
jgi:hypothetical protein